MKMMNVSGGFEVIDHTADWALRVTGDDLNELFIHAAQGMNSLLVERPEQVSLQHRKQLEIESFDRETLLVDWLSELAYWAEKELLVFGQFMLDIKNGTHLRAVIHGGHVENLQKHIKAVTYHDMEITQTEKGFVVCIVFDV
jgi:SHS2 domain-containing protein